MSAEPSPAWLVAGVVGRPHGLDGSFHVGAARPALLDGPLWVGGASRAVERRAGTDDRPILRLEGDRSRSDAEALRGERLLVPREAAPPLEEDEYWPEDLEGCAVVDGARPVGVVTRLLAYPSCDLLEVERPGSDSSAPLLVPLVRDAVRGIDVDARVVDVDLAFLGEA